ncbi:MAG: 50S ribosomal protein L24 [candidate division WOR-3 bacterium]|nr:50S ribosomal protein L24 [candidate division WOR-3 bacterium]MCX7947947.1 50S ribosomal protein L24 [candidate division WOR-3 bacterium]MDW8150891.1 50S ribosomal protein L24 [candidate division WOR-3 bacterium]
MAKIKKGDHVVVISGKDKGKKGRVLKVIYDEKTRKPIKVIVEGVNLVKKHQKARRANEKSEIVKKEAPIHISKVMIVDPKTGERTRVGFKFIEKKGKLIKVRYSKKSGEVLDNV